LAETVIKIFSPENTTSPTDLLHSTNDYVVTSSKSLRLVVSEETNLKVSVNKKKELHIAAMISATSK
jgi:hypothetical protein